LCLADNVSCCPIETFPKYLGDIKIAGRSLVAEVNSDNRAKRLRAEIEKRLGASAVHQTTSAKTAEEMLAKAPKRKSASEDDVIEQALLHDPEARGRFQQIIQKQAEDWVRRKVPALGGRTPLQAVQTPMAGRSWNPCFWTGNAVARIRLEFARTSMPSASY